MESFVSKSKFVLNLIDPETNINYNVTLNAEDYIKAKQDESFSQALLFHAKCNAKKDDTNDLCSGGEGEDVQSDCEEECEALTSSKVIYVWSYDQTLHFIEIMTSYLDDLNHPKKRKSVFENAANDMINSGFEINSTMAKNKWKSLLNSYRKAKDTKIRTGRGPSRFMFFDNMDEILGDKSTNSCSHCLKSRDLNQDNDTNTENNMQPPPSEIPDSPHSRTLNFSTVEHEPITTSTTGKRLREKTLNREYITVKEEEYQEGDEELEALTSSKVIYIWSYDQTLQFIEVMGSHLDDLNNPKKRKSAFENAVSDMINSGFEINTTMAKNKWKSLINSYKKAKNGKIKSGFGPSRFMFFGKMDEILSNQPTNSCNHSLDSYDLDQDNDVNTENNMQSSPTEITESPHSHTPNLSVVENEPIPQYHISKRLTEKRLKRDYITVKQEEYKKKQKRHEEWVELEKQKIRIESKKLELLERYLHNVHKRSTN